LGAVEVLGAGFLGEAAAFEEDDAEALAGEFGSEQDARGSSADDADVRAFVPCGWSRSSHRLEVMEHRWI
jgi:hypothetical protein